MKEETCEKRIAEHWRSRRADFRRFMRAEERGEESPGDDLGPFEEYGLSFGYVSAGTFTGQRRGFWCYLLSWGGPSDEIRFHESGRIEYRFHDWFDGAGRDITGTRVAEWLRERFTDWEMFESAKRKAERD